MYARNNASPRPITIGAVVQISDGAVQTAGVSVKVRKDAGSWATGAGTLAVEEGIWSYTPTQGETDCEALQIVIFKTSCIPNSMEVVTTSSSSFGHAGTDQSKIANASATQNLSGTTIKTATDIETDTQDIQSRLPASLDAGRIVATVGAYQSGNVPLQPTVSGRTLDVTATGAAGVDWGNVENQGATVNLAATIVEQVNSASLADPIGEIWEVATSSLTVAGTIGKLFVDNINATISSRLAASSYTAPLTTSGTASAVWDALLASYTVANSFGARVVRSLNSNNTLQLTGSNHAAADIHELQPAVIDDTHFAAGAIDANALAASAATEIATAVGTLQVLTDLVTMIINDGTATARWSAYSLGLAPTGGGGSATVNVLPYTGAVPDRVEGTTIKVFYNELTNVSVGVTDATGAAVTLDAKTLRFCVEDRYGADVLTLNDGDITRSGSTFTVQIPQSLTDTVGANYRWSLRDLTSSLNTVLIHGQMIVAEAAEDEA